MGKIKLLLFMVILCTTSCTPKTLNKPNMKGIIVDDKIDLDNNLEPEINNINIKEDNEVTQRALENTNVDYMLTAKDGSNNLDVNMDLNNIVVNKTFNLEEKAPYDVSLMYKKYLMPKDFILITKDKVSIYNKPNTDGNIIGDVYLYEKLKVMNEVIGSYIKEAESNKWYSVAWTNNEREVFYGFVPANVGQLRSFRFDKMHDLILGFEKELEKSKYGYVSNYKDSKGSPPLINNKGMDKYGMQAYQSAPLYYDLNNKEKFRYVPDGMMLFIIG